MSENEAGEGFSSNRKRTGQPVVHGKVRNTLCSMGNTLGEETRERGRMDNLGGGRGRKQGGRSFVVEQKAYRPAGRAW